MNKEETKRLKIIEEELAYLRKELQNYMEQKPVEIHYHYYYGYETMKEFLQSYYDLNDQN